ncbi:hypothetical protein EDC01DRAFT_20882 [Geopyxis carbonaria]|nr:hypothetical protein EDC01DRAFT_20882 [Geopyxis carbonaria]
MASAFTRLRTPRTIVCIGRNYADHIAELGNTRPTEPFYFLKPATSVLHPNAGPILSPSNCNLHYEVELAAIMGGTADELTVENALSKIKGYAVGVDMTARNCRSQSTQLLAKLNQVQTAVQEQAKSKKLPWALCKGFKTFLPVSHFIPRGRILNPHDVELYLSVNGQLRQKDSTKLMLFDIPQLLRHVTSIAPLEEDDILMTGTPKGVGPVVPGDVIEAGLRVNGVELEEAKIRVEVQARTSGYNSS